MCHWHPPAGAVSRTRVVVHADGSFYFQVLFQSGKIETIDQFLNLCEMIANVKGDYKFARE